MVSHSKRHLLKAAVALGVSIGMSANNITQAAFDAFLKIEGSDDDEKAYDNVPEIQVVSYEGNASKPSVKYTAKIKGSEMIVLRSDGWWYLVVEGRFLLPDNTIIVIQDAQIVKRIRAKL